MCNMKQTVKIILFVVMYFVAFSIVHGQAENVPAYHPVYPFLKRMEMKEVINRYHDAILPLSRRQVADFLSTCKLNKEILTSVEQNQLDGFSVEFQYELGGEENIHSLIESAESSFGKTVGSFFSTEKEKYLYTYTDSNLTFFVDGLLTLDTRRNTGDALGSANATFVQFGGRIRGTVYNKLGYYIHATNAQFWGSRNVLLRDKSLSQNYTLSKILDTQSFDNVDGYVRYDANIVSLQVGRERILWGNGYGDKLVASDNVRPFDFIRGDVEYKSLKYTFMHGWLLGKKSFIFIDNGSVVTGQEPVVADKYLAAHRLEFSFPSLFDIGFQEALIYSNRSVDLAYLNPVTLFESVQRSREERDNNTWSFDIQTHWWKNVEFQGTILFDDINFPKFGTNSVQNKFAYQGGTMFVDPLGLSNVNLAVEYNRVEPFTFSHSRSRDNDYGSFGQILSHHIGPNADSWFFRIDNQLTHRLSISARYEIVREGENVDSAGVLIQNVGGDFLVSNSNPDQTKDFLGGNFVRSVYGQFFITYELVNEIFLDARYQYTRRADFGKNTITVDHDFGIALRFDF